LGDQVGAQLLVAGLVLFVRLRRPLPSRLTIQMSLRPDRVDTNASCVPSGDHAAM
jgi:hypothetical protein